jgi:hypothetical protein
MVFVQCSTATFQLGYELDVFDIHYGFVPFATIAGQNYLHTHKPWDQKSAHYVQIEQAEMSNQVQSPLIENVRSFSLLALKTFLART